MDLEPLISKAKIGSAGITGSWRNYRPVFDVNLCTKCDMCTIYCPEGVIVQGEVNYEFCKGCGICKEICKQRAIKMVQE
ncbi:MAG: 4Fe-4S binding protein [Archaeoglobaceae archaeon]|nr:4Fe-4S binding protein [Archaeoglobaceae archaeon]MDW7989739.1 4Fe-4S binding protein [Archaeoglobaceae archaeon]